jgi:hypothetical protein
VAVNNKVDAGAITAEAGVTAMDFRVAELTVKSVDPDTPPKVAPMFAVPEPTAVTKPMGPTVATAVLSDAQVASRLRTCVLESLNVPVAVNCNWVAGAMVRPEGETDINVIVAFVTSSTVEPGIPPRVAEMVELPGVSPLANPLLPPTVAAAVLEELHVTRAVKLCVLPSVKVPVAENCSLVFCAMLGLAGRTVIETRFFASTVEVTLPVIAPEVAVMVTVPRFLPVASPLTVIEATAAGEELHPTLPVMSCVVLSENVPVAVNCCTVPSGMDTPTGVTLMEVRVALVMVRTALEETLPEAPVALAVIVDVPGATPIASPGAPFTLILTAEGFDDVQVANAVTFCMLPSVMAPVAVNCTFVPCAIFGLVDETANETTAGGFTVSVVLPFTPESEPVIVAVPCATVATAPAVETVATVLLEDVQVTEVVRSWLVPSL